MPDPTTVAATVSSWQGVAALAVLILGPHVVTYVQARRTRRDTRIIRDQTENSHANAEFPNLREQLDAMHADIRTAASEAGAAAAKADAAATEATAAAAKADTAAQVAAVTQTALAAHVAQGDRLRRPLFSWRS